MASRSISQRNTSFGGVTIKRAVVRNELPEFISKMERRAQLRITEALILGGAEASALTPIDTGTLINSQFRHVRKVGQSIVGTVGFTADYAMAVHDPDNQQSFRRPSAVKEFLKKGFERAEPQIRAVLRGGLKV